MGWKKGKERKERSKIILSVWTESDAINFSFEIKMRQDDSFDKID